MVYGNANWSGPVVGTTPQYFAIREWKLANGRVFDEDDVEEGRKVALLGRTVVEKLFGTLKPVGEEIRINRGCSAGRPESSKNVEHPCIDAGVPVLVIGELASKGESLGGFDQDDVVFIPITTAMNRIIGRHPA